MKNIHLAVYGTLKKNFFWHSILENIKATYLYDDYIEFSILRNISGITGENSVPHVIFGKGTKKFIYVEVYSVKQSDFETILDPFEEYNHKKTDPYTRIECFTISGKKVFIYNSNLSGGNDEKEFFLFEKNQIKFYNWHE